MNDKHDFDGAVDRWLDDGSDATPPEVIDAVLLAIRSTPQERDFRFPWRTTSMKSYLQVAAVVAFSVIASTAAIITFGPGGSGFGGPNATPSPRPALLARGDFVSALRGERVELEATGEGSSVTGRMTVSGVSGEDWFFTVDLQCTRATEDGLIMIGGVTTDADYLGGGLSPEGTWAAIVLKRGSPVEATVWSQRGGATSGADSCLAFLDEQYDEQLIQERNIVPNADHPGPIEGTVELGP